MPFDRNPETGRPNPERVAAFLEAHPETQAAREWQASYTATESYATETYNSINAFYLVNGRQRQAVRWAAVPQAESHTAAALKVIAMTRTRCKTSLWRA